jgi:hypothetical protein
MLINNQVEWSWRECCIASALLEEVQDSRWLNWMFPSSPGHAYLETLSNGGWSCSVLHICIPSLCEIIYIASCAVYCQSQNLYTIPRSHVRNSTDRHRYSIRFRQSFGTALPLPSGILEWFMAGSLNIHPSGRWSRMPADSRKKSSMRYYPRYRLVQIVLPCQ